MRVDTHVPSGVPQLEGAGVVRENGAVAGDLARGANNEPGAEKHELMRRELVADQTEHLEPLESAERDGRRAVDRVGA